MSKKECMEALAKEAGEKGLFNGAWLFANHGEIVSAGAVGWQDPENTVPLTTDSVFDLASVSKQFTAAAVMLLRRRGLIDLDDELTKFWPDLPYPGVKIRHLLTHTSGLPDYMGWVDRIAKKENTIPGNDIVIRFLREAGEKPLFAPGEGYAYCNTAYCVLAELVETLSGVKFEDFMRDEIFEPAGMHATRVRHPRKEGAFENWARAMVRENGRYVLPEASERDPYVVTLDGESGDGYVYSSANDLFRWDQALRAEKVLTKEEQEMMYAPSAKIPGTDEENVGYGFGWVVFHAPELGRVLSHSGGWPGVSTWYGRYLDADRVLVLLNCRQPTDGRGGDAFFRAMSAVGRGEDPPELTCIEDIAVKSPDKSGWAAFCGKYEPDPGDDYIDEVFMKDGELWANIVSDLGYPYTWRLYPLGENTFGFKEDEDDIEVEFGDGCFTVDGETHKKL